MLGRLLIVALMRAQEPEPGPGAEPDVPDLEPEAPVPPPGVTPAPGAPSDPATNEAGKRIAVGIDGVFLFPLGNFGDQTGTLIGPITRFGYRVASTVEIAVRVGYLFAITKDQGRGVETKLDLLPVWLEARWFVLHPFGGPYAALGGGMNIYLPTVTPPIPGVAGDQVTQARQRFGANLGAGYVLSAFLPLDLRVQVVMPNLGGQDSALKEKTDIGVSLCGGYTLQF